MADFIELTRTHKAQYFKTLKFNFSRTPIKPVYHAYHRLIGRYSKEDQIRIACYCWAPPLFLQYGVMMPHPFGITLSADEIGADCLVGQNVTIGTDGRNVQPGGTAVGHQPRIGNLVRIYAGAIISGEISVGDYVVIGGNAVVSKDVPSGSFVSGVNQTRPLEEHHIGLLQMSLYHATYIYRLLPGLTYKQSRLYIDADYLTRREELIKSLGGENFRSIMLQKVDTKGPMFGPGTNYPRRQDSHVGPAKIVQQ